MAKSNPIEKAKQARQEGKLEDAITACREAVKRFPKKAEYHHYLGETLSKKGQVEEAISAYRQTIALRPNWFKAHHDLGVALRKIGETDLAVASFLRSIELKETFTFSYFELGKLYSQQGSFDLAIDYFKTAINFHPPAKSFWFHMELGNAFLQQGILEEAISAYQKANEINPGSALCHSKLGKALAQQGKLEAAIATYRQAIEIKPDLATVHLELGDILYQVGQFDEAVSCYREAKRLKPNDAKAYQRLQQGLAKQSNWQDPELETLYRAVESKPQDPDSYYKLGKSLTKRGLVEEAVECYISALRINYKLSRIYEDLKHATLNLKRLDHIIDFYREIIEARPTFVPAYVNLAYTLTLQNKPHEATLWYQKAIDQKTASEKPKFLKAGQQEEKSREPHFIIIGAEKCGTSSLYNYITRHPQILGPIEKEIHFFTYHFNKGMDWYLAHFPAIPKASGYLSGEASTSYIGCHNNAPRHLYRSFPDVKLIAILRNPVDRAISHYNQLVRLGREDRPLEEVINSEMAILNRVENIWSVRQNYWRIGKGTLWHSLYVYFLEEWLRVFPKEQLLILKSEDLFNRPKPTMQSVFEFLEIAHYQRENYPVVNSGSSYNQPSEELRARMSEFFTPSIEQLKTVLDVELSI